MNLPFVLDIGLGLIFIYLTLSILASECQELLTTVFQWRALHLKQAIETLLAGESKPILQQPAAEQQLVQAQIDRSKALANRLYDHPLIRSLEHESKGTIGRVAAQISRFTRASNAFAGKASAPSYLPSDTFATALLELLSIGDIAYVFFEQKLQQLVGQPLLKTVEELIGSLRQAKANPLLLEEEWQHFQAELNRSVQAGDRSITVADRLSQVSGTVKRLLLASEAVLLEPVPAAPNDVSPDHTKTVFLKRLAAIEPELPSVFKEAKPNIAEVVTGLNHMAWVTQLLQQSSDDHQTILSQLTDATLKQRFQAGYDLLQLIQQRLQDSSQGQAFQSVLTTLSPHLCDSLALLATQVQSETDSIEQDLNQLQKEVARWFDRSMDRSAGVYKRNAKGVALMLGVLLAITTNTDTLHLIDRLASDATLRSTYSQAASTLVSNNPNAIACLQTEQGNAAPVACLNNGTTALRDAIRRATDLPIGWNPTNWQEQWRPDHSVIAAGLKVLAGWLVSAIAIAMGAPFWFNLLNKVVNVRNSGKPPASTSQTDTKE